MDVERVERALREGPADEPRYVPGAFGRPPARSWLLAVAGGTLAVALVIGLAVGFGLNVLRSPNVGGPAGSVDPRALAAELRGTWTTEVITAGAWERGIAARGFDANDIDAFLIHDPIASGIRYRLEVEPDSLTISSSTDGAPFVGNTSGTWSILDDGSLSYADVPAAGPGPGADCVVTARFTIGDGRLAFEPIATAGCGLDERLANTAFLNLAPFGREE